VGPNETLIFHELQANNGRSELSSADLRRGDRTVAKFPPPK
jgi:hypothetical protein